MTDKSLKERLIEAAQLAHRWGYADYEKLSHDALAEIEKLELQVEQLKTHVRSGKHEE